MSALNDEQQQQQPGMYKQESCEQATCLDLKRNGRTFEFERWS